MRLGILGSGVVAQTLGSAYLAKGHDVKLGTRTPAKLSDWLKAAGKRASVGSFADAAEFGEAIFMCTLGSAAVESAGLAGRDSFSGKTLIDVTNALDFSNGTPPTFMSILGNSLGEKLQRAMPFARVVKAFNCTSAEVMANPMYDGKPATMLIAGNDDKAKAEVKKLAGQLGWETEDVGNIDMAFYLEAFAMISINYGFKHNSWNHAIRFLNRKSDEKVLSRAS